MKRKELDRECGLLTLEACIAVVIFIFLMLFMYSFFILFEARNMMAHATLSAADSVALDAYESCNETDRDTLAGLLSALYNERIPDESPFTDAQNWYADATREEENLRTGLEREVVKERFLAYLGGGDSARADDILKRLHIRKGSQGLDFSETHASGGKLYVSVRYTIDLEYNIFAPDGLEIEHTACSKIWGK